MHVSILAQPSLNWMTMGKWFSLWPQQLLKQLGLGHPTSQGAWHTVGTPPYFWWSSTTPLCSLGGWWKITAQQTPPPL